jgi:hypothetical protein
MNSLCVSLYRSVSSVFRTVVLLVLLVSPAFATRVERLIDTWRPEHYVLDITLDDRLSEITSATARVNVFVVKQTNLIDFDFGEMRTDSITLNSKPLQFVHKDGKLNITLPSAATPKRV